MRRKVKDVADYFVAGRRITLPIMVATLVATWYGGILGVGELSFNYGIVNWLTQGFFWYMSYLFFAFFLAQKIRKSNFFTIPDQLGKYYDKKAQFLGAILNFIMVTPAPYIFSLGMIFSLLFGIKPWIMVLVCTIMMVFYSMRGGYYGLAYADFIHFFFMMIGIAIVIPFAVFKYGGRDFLTQNLPKTHFMLFGTWSVQMIIVWGFIAFWTLVDPSFYQACYAAKDSKTARNGILVAILFWAMFDICTTFIGMYARAAMPNINPITSIPVFALSVLPVALKGLFISGLVATILSTIDSFMFIGAMNISNDIYKGHINPKATEKQIFRMTKIGLIFSAAIAFIIAITSESIVGMWYTIGTIGISALLVPMLFGLFGKVKNQKSGFYSMLVGVVISGAWMAYGYVNLVDGWPSYPFAIEPLYPGLMMSLVVFLIINYKKNHQVNVDV